MWNKGDNWVPEGSKINLQHEALYQLCLDLRDSNIIDQQLFKKLYHDRLKLFFLWQMRFGKTGTMEKKGIELHPQNRIDRTKALMWLVDEAQLKKNLKTFWLYSTSKKSLSVTIPYSRRPRASCWLYINRDQGPKNRS